MTAPDTRSAAQIAADNAFAGTDRRSPDEIKAMEKAFAAGTLPEVDRRAYYPTDDEKAEDAVVAEAVPVQAAHSQPPTVPMGPETVKARVKQLEAIGEARTEAESRELYEIRPQIV